MKNERQVEEDHVRQVRTGHGANCSSVGSVVDTLFATATLGAALFASVLAALRSEPLRVVAQDSAKGLGRGAPEDTRRGEREGNP